MKLSLFNFLFYWQSHIDTAYVMDTYCKCCCCYFKIIQGNKHYIRYADSGQLNHFSHISREIRIMSLDYFLVQQD